MPKLVRDRIPEIMIAKGETPRVRILHDDKEYMQALRDKLLEEVVEFEENPSIEELVDVMEVVEALYFLVKKTGGDVDGAKKFKRRQKGRFKRRVMLLES